MVIDFDVKERLAVSRPFEAAARLRNFVREVQARLEIADADRIELGAFVVGRGGEQLVVVRVRRRAQVPIDFARGFGVAVE